MHYTSHSWKTTLKLVPLTALHPLSTSTDMFGPLSGLMYCIVVKIYFCDSFNFVHTTSVNDVPGNYNALIKHFHFKMDISVFSLK